ncbi:hypothetical protein [Ruminococcus flavefaciens]|uniref:hypothetical protein n=1 Tax=Ruminococcus flavefaciens TaxID=1265 RepID=UPI0026EE863A|nr:hypothetical protein [Ruminococcus flavefaciens]
MIGVLIKYKEKIMFAGLPKDSDRLKNQLSRIGLDISPHEINLTSNNDYGYEIEIYGQDSAEIAICARICSSDTLGQLNELMQYLDNNEVDDLYEVVVDGDSESISELYSATATAHNLIGPNTENIIISPNTTVYIPQYCNEWGYEYLYIVFEVYGDGYASGVWSPDSI